MLRKIPLILLLIPIFLYWVFVTNCSFCFSTNVECWKDFATFFGGVYGPIFSGMALYYLIKQVKIANENNTTALKALETAQESTNFNIMIFQLKTILAQIKYLKTLNVVENENWAITFKMVLSDISMFSYDDTLKTESSRNAIKTLHSQLLNFFLKDSESIYLDNKGILFTEQIETARILNFKEIDDMLSKLKQPNLTSVGDEEPNF